MSFTPPPQGISFIPCIQGDGPQSCCKIANYNRVKRFRVGGLRNLVVKPGEGASLGETFVALEFGFFCPNTPAVNVCMSVEGARAFAKDLEANIASSLTVSDAMQKALDEVKEERKEKKAKKEQEEEKKD